jgi:hypothetical protein
VGKVTRIVHRAGIMSFGVEGGFDDAQLTRQARRSLP